VHGVVLEQVDDLDGAAEHVTGEPVGVLRVGQPAGGAVTHLRVAHALGHGVGGEEAALDELAERLAELLLALGDDRRVGDGQPEGVAEQGDHGEPVGQPAHHRRLGRGLHVAEPRAAVGPRHHGDDEHARDGGEQRGRPSPRGDQLEALALFGGGRWWRGEARWRRCGGGHGGGSTRRRRIGQMSRMASRTRRASRGSFVRRIGGRVLTTCHR
jgi:hypothetical protein